MSEIMQGYPKDVHYRIAARMAAKAALHLASTAYGAFQPADLDALYGLALEPADKPYPHVSETRTIEIRHTPADERYSAKQCPYIHHAAEAVVACRDESLTPEQAFQGAADAMRSARIHAIYQIHRLMHLAKGHTGIEAFRRMRDQREAAEAEAIASHEEWVAAVHAGTRLRLYPAQETA